MDIDRTGKLIKKRKKQQITHLTLDIQCAYCGNVFTETPQVSPTTYTTQAVYCIACNSCNIAYVPTGR